MPGGQTLKAVILGITGSGKSTLMQEIIDSTDRIVVLDSMGDYTETKGAIVCEGANDCINKLLELQDTQHWKLICITLEEQEALDILAVAFDVENISIAVDESSLYCTPTYLPKEFKQLIRYGRKRGIHLFFIARRPSEIHRELTAQSNLLVTFIQYEPLDIKYLQARMGKKAELAKTLPKYEILVHGDMELAPLAVLKRVDSKKQLTLEEQAE